MSEAQEEAVALAINIEGWTFLGEHEPGCMADGCQECRSVCIPVARAAIRALAGVE